MKGVLASGSDAIEFLAATFIGEAVPRREQHSPSSATIFFVHRFYAKISSARKPLLKKKSLLQKNKILCVSRYERKSEMCWRGANTSGVDRGDHDSRRHECERGSYART